MTGGKKFLGCTALLAIAACGGEQAKLEVRAMPTPLAQGTKTVSFRVAEGHQQMALGNVALALESYRRALRDDPKSIEAFAGIAAGYDRMGRYDMSQRSYEAALAVEPGNTMILAMLAASLEQQGKKAEAFAVRDEIQQRLASAATAPQEVAATAVATIAIEAPLPAPDLEATQPSLASAPLSVSTQRDSAATTLAVFEPDQPVVAAPVAAIPQATPIAMADVTAPARSVTVTLPRPVAAPIKTAQKVDVVAPTVPQPQTPVASHLAAAALPTRPTRPAIALPVATGSGPKLERTSMGEVALLTGRSPQWASLVVKQNQRSATVRFVPLRQASARLASVRLLNAARVQGLAARTRSTLFNRGWRSIAIGDASVMRARSIVQYPANRRATALSLARQFGFAAEQRASGREITVLLGRDAALMARRLPAA